MKAPKKIYLEKEYPDNRILPNGISYSQTSTNIEYIRTDAFIEKAAQWLFNQANIYTDIEIDRNNGGVYTKFYADEMVKDFIKAMKL